MDNVIIKFTVPIVPVTKKNHQRILKNRRTGKHFVAPSEQYEQYENAALWFIPRRGAPIDFPVNVRCLFYMPTNRPCDLTNHLESIDDIMVKAGLLKDDNYKILVAHDGSRVLVDKEKPRTEVVISKI
jgi:Holliday junction resolvase RusA-like endonuclease